MPALAWDLAPAAGAAAALELLVPWRADWLGHFSAGYGATLAVGLLAAWLARGPRLAIWQARAQLAVALAAVAAGAALEATVFRYAEFDPLDFSIQSLGAVLAALVVLAAPPPAELRPLAARLALAAAWLAGGFVVALG